MAPAQDERSLRARGVAFLQHFQRVEEFLTELILAPADIRLRRQHAERISALFAGTAEAALASPDREHHGCRHAEVALDARERVTIFGGKRAALRGETRKRGFLQIVRRRLHEFRLPVGPLRLAGDRQIRQRQIGLEIARCGVERGARHAELLRLRAQRLQELLERRVSGKGIKRRDGKPGKRQPDEPHACPCPVTALCVLAIAGLLLIRSTAAMPTAERMKTVWMMVCHITPVSV